jgi:hypothetical protein
MPVAPLPSGNPAADAARLLGHLGLAILMIALPLFGVVSKGAIYILLPVGAVLVFIAEVLDSGEHGARQLRLAITSGSAVAALFLAFWAGLSLVWTPFQAEASERFLKALGTMGFIALVAAFLPERTKPTNLYLLPVGLALTVLAVLVMTFYDPQRIMTASEFNESLFERSILTLIVLVWPALGALSLREHWVSAALLALAVAGVTMLGRAQISLAAMGAGAFTFAVAMSAPVKTARFLVVIFTPLILLAPAIPLLFHSAQELFGLHPEAASPMTIWADLVARDGLRLITGHGLDMATGAVSQGYLPVTTPKSLLFLIWYELGAIGAIALAAFVMRAFLGAGKAPASVAPALLAALTSVLTIAIFGLATVQIWWVSLLGCDILAFALLVKGVYRTKRPTSEEIEAIEEDPSQA